MFYKARLKIVAAKCPIFPEDSYDVLPSLAAIGEGMKIDPAMMVAIFCLNRLQMRQRVIQEHPDAPNVEEFKKILEIEKRGLSRFCVNADISPDELTEQYMRVHPPQVEPEPEIDEYATRALANVVACGILPATKEIEAGCFSVARLLGEIKASAETVAVWFMYDYLLTQVPDSNKREPALARLKQYAGEISVDWKDFVEFYEGMQPFLQRGGPVASTRRA